MNMHLSELIKTLCSITSKKEMEDFLHGILTPAEMAELPVRLQIVKLLKRGIPQHEIAKQLKVGVATVTRGSKEIAKGHFSCLSQKGWRPRR